MMGVVCLIFFVVTSAFLGFVLTKVPFVQTRSADIELVVKKLKMQKDQKFIDLGSGDGKVCFIVHKLSGAVCVGYELTWWTHLLAKLRALKFKKKVNFYNKNFFKVSWTETDYVYGYLYPPLMGKIEEKFLKECKPGSIAIIRDFPFPNLIPEEKMFLPGKHEIYIYLHK